MKTTTDIIYVYIANVDIFNPRVMFWDDDVEHLKRVLIESTSSELKMPRKGACGTVWKRDGDSYVMNGWIIRVRKAKQKG